MKILATCAAVPPTMVEVLLRANHSESKRRDATSPSPGKLKDIQPMRLRGIWPFLSEKANIFARILLLNDEIRQNLVVSDILKGPARFCEFLFEGFKPRWILGFDTN